MNKQFICATRDYSTLSDGEHFVPSPMLRRSFHLDTLPDKAELSVCGLGFYLLFINGHDITKGALAPYVSNPDHYCYYDTYDLLPYLTEGENVIGLILGSGMLNNPGGAVWDFHLAECRGPSRVALELTVEQNGETSVLMADSSFKTHPSPILLDDYRIGEHYDARLEQEGWNRPGFDDSSWTPALPAETPRGELRLCRAEPIRVMRELKPVSITREGDGYLYDFGLNSAGVCRLSVRGKAGQRITMKHGEVLKDGQFYHDNLNFNPDKYPFYRDHTQTAVLIASGKEDVYVPKFTYYGFRYVLVEGIEEHQATEELLTYLVLSSDLRTVGGFSCSDERINALYRAAVNADRSNFYYFPTDCPHREKNGWTGDASLSADHMILAYDVEASYEEWLANIRKAQNGEGALPGIVPTFGWGFRWGNGPTWDSVLFNLPYVLYRLRGNTRVIRDNAHAMVRYLSYILTRRGEDGTVAVGLGDYVPAGKDRAGHPDVPLAVTDSIMVMDMARKAAEMLRAVGMDHESAFAESVFRDMREVIRRELIDTESGLVAGNCQSGQAIALYYGAFDEEEEPRAFERLLAMIREKHDSFDCGFIGMHCIFHVLTRFGASELAYRMITKPEFPSYGYALDQGETSLIEWFKGDGTDIKISHNHHFQGDILRWFTDCLAGLHIVDSTTVELCPHPVSNVTEAEAWYDLPLGRVSVSWKKKADGSLDLRYTCPEGVRCILPARM